MRINFVHLQYVVWMKEVSCLQRCLFSRIKCRYLSDVGETASNLGTAMDELMRHQPTLKTDAMTAIIKVFYYTLQSHLSLGSLCRADTFINVC